MEDTEESEEGTALRHKKGVGLATMQQQGYDKEKGGRELGGSTAMRSTQESLTMEGTDSRIRSSSALESAVVTVDSS